MKEQQKRKFKQIHPEIEDGIDLRRLPLKMNASVISYLFPKHQVRSIEGEGESRQEK